MLELPCTKNSPVLIKTESSRAEMRKLLPSHLTYTITKEHVRARRKIFSLYFLYMLPTAQFRRMSIHFIKATNFIFSRRKEIGTKKMSNRVYCQSNSQVTLQEWQTLLDELQLNFEVERTKITTAFCARGLTVCLLL